MDAQRTFGWLAICIFTLATVALVLGLMGKGGLPGRPDAWQWVVSLGSIAGGIFTALWDRECHKEEVVEC